MAVPPKDAQGLPITDPLSLSSAKLDFFSQNEAATLCQPEQLASLYQSTCNARPDLREGGVGIISNIHNIPAATSIVNSFAHSSRHKGAGCDSIVDDLHFLAPHELARIWHPLYTKMSLNIAEPLSFRGSLLINF